MESAKNNLSQTFLNLMLGDWHIDADYARVEFNRYMEKIELLSNGATMFDVFSEEKANSKRISIVDASGAIKDVSSLDQVTENSIIQLNFSGVMRNADGLCSQGVNSLTEQLYNSYGNSAVKGILLNLESGGGESSSGYNLQQALLDKNKPVVVRSSFLASAALNGAAAANEIWAASDASQIGSIGSYISVSLDALNEYKKNVKDIYSTTSPDKNAAFRAALDGDFSKLEKDVTQNASLFQEKVKGLLNLKSSLEASTLSGGVFYAQDAKNRGLVHGVGTKQLAIKRILSLIKYS